MSELLTIGYEGATPQGFDATLTAARVELVVDVRAVAASRRQGFAKSALSDRLAHAGIRYIHLRELGDPKPGREAARAGRWAEFRAIFSAHLNTPDAAFDLPPTRVTSTKPRETHWRIAKGMDARLMPQSWNWP